MSEKSLKEKTVSGLGWSAIDKLFQQAFVLFSGIALARMVGKDQFGLISVLGIFSALANVLLDSGFSSALIRKKDITQSDYMTVFYSNIAIGGFLYVVLFFCAPLISQYYNEPILTPLSRVLFLSFLFNAFAGVQSVKLIKDINYSFTTKNNIISILVSYSAALILAYLGYGVWALVAQIVIVSFVKSFIFWVFTDWRPSGRFDKQIFKELFAFSSKLTVGSFLSSFISNIPQNVVGKQYSLGVAGLYNQANRLYATVLELLSGSIISVPYPVLSTINDQARFKNAFRKFVRAKAFLIFPLFMGMMLVANPFINVCLGHEWSEAVPILQLLCLGGIFTALDSSSGDLLKIKGKSGVILISVILHAILMLGSIGLILFLKLNYNWMIFGLSLLYLLKYIVMSIISNRMINYRLLELLKDLSPYLIISLATTYCGYLLHYFISNQLVLMLCQIPLVAILYIGILYLSGSTIVKEVFDLLRKNKRFI